jgi:N-acetylneuraminic acid mutarotase
MKMSLFLNRFKVSHHNSVFYHPRGRKNYQISQNIPLTQKRIILILFLVGVFCLALYLGNLEKNIFPIFSTNQSENPNLSKKELSSASNINTNNGNIVHPDKIPTLKRDIWIRATDSAAFPARIRHTSIVFNDRMWVIAGEGEHGERLRDVWYSSDGSRWSASNISAEFPGRYDSGSVVFDGRMWIIGGYGVSEKSPSKIARHLNDTWYSGDGVVWKEATGSAAFSGRSDADLLVYHDKMWIIGGYGDGGEIYNDVWYSSDGIQWFEANASVAFPARLGATSVVYDDRIWIMGGLGSNIFPLNDVWSSSDGIVWNEDNASAAFPKRYQATSAVYDNKMWILGGSNGKSGVRSFDGKSPRQFFNDVWFSTDGVIWTPANVGTDEGGSDTSIPIFQPRMSHTSVIYKDKIWVIAGGLNRIMDKTAGPFDIRFMNDTWYSESRVSDGITDPMNGNR